MLGGHITFVAMLGNGVKNGNIEYEKSPTSDPTGLLTGKIVSLPHVSES
jgi:hypothetical protein